MSGTAFLINLTGAVALLLWGMRMASTGVSRAFGSGLRQRWIIDIQWIGFLEKEH